MVIKLVAAGSKSPAWVSDGYTEFARRMPRECRLELEELPAVRRGKGASADESRRTEGERMLRAIARGDHVVALDSKGRQWSTEALAAELERWLLHPGGVTLLIGGPDGLAPACLDRADQVWSLSQLTFPHQLVRVIVAEQLYRAWSYLKGHPYHRAH